ncbi:MAG: DNA polymerase III subunit delta' [Cyanobium sp. M30B3]|jgi:DNA polymerase III subunit delta'|nr:MAG: DNA polymerase III subunit delta' [Cyanobium sp. M30B3]
MSALFAHLVGQQQARTLLLAALAQGRLAPAYLFAGPHGVGRRLAAMAFLEGVLAGIGGDAGLRRRLQQGNHPDLLWVEPTYLEKGQLVPRSQAEAAGVSRRSAPQLRLDQIREVSRFLGRRPLEAERCVVVLDGVEAMAEAAANALLKTLEEPGDGLLILIASAPEQLLSTIRSRCQVIPFGRLRPDEIERVLPPTSGLEPQDPAELVQLAAGSPGALQEHRRHWQALPEGVAGRLLQLVEGDGDPLQALELARDLSESLDGEQQQWLVQWWQQALWNRHRQAAMLHRLNRLGRQLQAYVQPRLAWEVALLELAGSGVRPG